LGDPLDTDTTSISTDEGLLAALDAATSATLILAWKETGVSENETMTTPDADTGGVWLDVVAATDYLAAIHPLGITIWEAVEEAIRWWTIDHLTLPGELPDGAFSELPRGDDPDPRPTSVERLLASISRAGAPDGLELGVIQTSALDNSVRRMADQYNDGHRFAHPKPRDG